MHTSRRLAAVARAASPFLQFEADSAWARRGNDPALCDFVFGKPQEMPLPEFAAALGRWSVPRDKSWFGYKVSEPAARAAVAASLSASRGLPFLPEDICLTNGSSAALCACLCALTDPEDEVVFISPPWFFYEALIVTYGARPVRVGCDPETFDLDLPALRAAITERTRAIIVNSPHNPTGRIYPPATLRGLAELLTAAGEQAGRPIYLLSDEAYSHIVFDGRAYHSPASFYPYSLLIYTYGKTLLTPGERLGYVAIPPTCPEREALRAGLFTAQLVTGYAFPNALLQHALPDLETLTIDIAHLQRKRDRLIQALRGIGYTVHEPEGTFYVLVRSPWRDDRSFVELLARHGVYCLPGAVVELPGYFRLSLTSDEATIERSLPGFAAAFAAPPAS